jgi:hypothetical protein
MLYDERGYHSGTNNFVILFLLTKKGRETVHVGSSIFSPTDNCNRTSDNTCSLARLENFKRNISRCYLEFWYRCHECSRFRGVVLPWDIS